MRKVLCMICTLCLLLLILGGCDLSPEKQLRDSVGKYKEIVYYCTEGFQDFTKYGKYQYYKVKLDNHKHFKPVSQDDIDVLMGYIENFESWVELNAENGDEKLTQIYDFDMSLVDASDYLYIYDDPDCSIEYGDYSVYFFDSQSMILYFFHNNI